MSQVMPAELTTFIPIGPQSATHTVGRIELQPEQVVEAIEALQKEVASLRLQVGQLHRQLNIATG